MILPSSSTANKKFALASSVHLVSVGDVDGLGEGNVLGLIVGKEEIGFEVGDDVFDGLADGVLVTGDVGL